MMQTITKRVNEIVKILNLFVENEGFAKVVSEVSDVIIKAFRSGNKLMICGNGGSAADAQHMAGEFLCRFYKDRAPLPAIALTTDTSVITAISNDYSYNDVFSRQVKALGKRGDVLLGISTSGSSENVLEAFKVAKEKGIKTILLTGAVERDIARLSDIVIKTPSSDTPRIQEMHLIIEHIICEIVEKKVLCKIKAVFIDRDGTINVEKGYVFKIEDFELLPGSLEALKLLTQHKIKIYIVTNQAGIAKGYYTEDDFRTLTDYMLKRFQNDGIKAEKVLYCPHHPEGTIPEYSIKCNCRKPDIGLVDTIMKQEGFHASEAALIGDKNSDIEAGSKLGIRTYLVLTGYGLEHQESTKASFIQPDFLSAVNHLLQDINQDINTDTL